jgi:hypothetical protein
MIDSSSKQAGTLNVSKNHFLVKAAKHFYHLQNWLYHATV